jgi:hypothetical protein
MILFGLVFVLTYSTEATGSDSWSKPPFSHPSLYGKFRYDERWLDQRKLFPNETWKREQEQVISDFLGQIADHIALGRRCGKVHVDVEFLGFAENHQFRLLCNQPEPPHR